MHHQKRVHLATRSVNLSMLPVTYQTVATQEVIRDLDPKTLARLKSEILERLFTLLRIIVV